MLQSELMNKKANILHTDLLKPNFPGSEFVWMNGEIVPLTDANISVLNHTLHYGCGVFEGERAYSGKVFKMKEHQERFLKSANWLGFTIPYSVDQLNEAIMQILEKNDLLKDSAYIRPIAFKAFGTLWIGTDNNIPQVAIAAWKMPSTLSTTKGIRVIWAPWERPSPKSYIVPAKTCGQYITGTLSKDLAIERGYDDAIMLDYRGFVSESTASNIFMVKDSVVHTPVADCALNGITRQTVIQLLLNDGKIVIERNITPAEFLDADEVFITGTGIEVKPIIAIEDKKFVNGTSDEVAPTVIREDKNFAIGPITNRIIAMYHKAVLDM